MSVNLPQLLTSWLARTPRRQPAPRYRIPPYCNLPLAPVEGAGPLTRARHWHAPPTTGAFLRAALARARTLLSLGLLVIVTGCAGLPPGVDYQKSNSAALAQPTETALGARYASAAQSHPGLSAFRLVPAGFQGYLLRAQMIGAAQKTIDMQYYIFHADESGKLLLDAILHAADRGVRVRMLIDDLDNFGEDTRIEALDAHPNIEVRLYNPLRYRGSLSLLRYLELTFNAPRLDHRMHNKQLVIDNSIALVGGRNVGDEYFQRDPQEQQGDFETYAAGPIVPELSKSFDTFWASRPAIPAEALFSHRSAPDELDKLRHELTEHRQEKRADGSDFVTRVATGEPLKGMLEGRIPLTWAQATVEGDAPEKPHTPRDERYTYLRQHPMGRAMLGAKEEFSIISAYFVPGDDGMRLLEEMRARGVRIRIVTNSLAANNEPTAHSGYLHYRTRLLRDGVEVHEERARPDSPRGTAQPLWLSSLGNYSLHTKLYIFDHSRLLVGSMNFDQRSFHINTELALLIDSPALAEQGLQFFDALAQPANAYAVTLEPRPDGSGQRTVWRTEEDKQEHVYYEEPAKDGWQRFKVHMFSVLPLDSEL